MNSQFKFIAEELRRQIEDNLVKVGLLCRVFSRGKDDLSLERKLTLNPGKYNKGAKLIQDVIGVRVALYFSEDIALVKSILEKKFNIDIASSTIDKPDSDQFSVTRYNLIFRLPHDLEDGFLRIVNDRPLDTCFEVQLRSILSEGWHEVEHDLRYKSKEDWNEHDDLSRTLNGVLATLETAEWSMGRIFDELSYRHYKTKNWSAMLPNLLKMRMRDKVSEQLTDSLNSSSTAAKDLLRLNRNKFIMDLFAAHPTLPLTMDNLIYFWNSTGPRHSSLLEHTPELILEISNKLTSQIAKDF